MLRKHLRARHPFRYERYWRHDRMNFQTIVGVGIVRKRCKSQAHQRKMRREALERALRRTEWFDTNLGPRVAAHRAKYEVFPV